MNRLCRQLILAVSLGFPVGTAFRAAAADQAAPALSPAAAAGARDLEERLRFAPMWLAIPKFPPDPNAKMLPPAAAFALVWQSAWQDELQLTPEQRAALAEIHAQALAETDKQTKRFKSLTQAEQDAEVASWDGKSAPWRTAFEKEFYRQVASVLTAEQIKTLREHNFPAYAVGLLYDPKVRRRINFTAKQQQQFRGIAFQRQAREQALKLEHAEAVWNLLTPEQRIHVVDVVNRQGPTSAVLSIAYEIGFDLDAISLQYPLLAAAPVRERLGFTEVQSQQLDQIKAQAAQARAAGRVPSHDDPDPGYKRALDALLTPAQLAALEEIDLRRKVVLALGYPEKRESISMSNEQQASLERLNHMNHAKLYQMDREMLATAVNLLDSQQKQQLQAEIAERIGG
jgi:hypothetical protein